jgi:hypothetical protein
VLVFPIVAVKGFAGGLGAGGLIIPVPDVPDGLGAAPNPLLPL